MAAATAGVELNRAGVDDRLSERRALTQAPLDEVDENTYTIRAKS